GVDAARRQRSRDLAWTAAEIAHAPTTLHGRGEAVEDLAIERLAVELVEILLRVLLGDRVVARHDPGAPAGRRRRHKRAVNAFCIRSRPSVSSARGVPKFRRTNHLPATP